MGMWGFGGAAMVSEQDALPGRTETIRVSERHEVLGNPLLPPFPEGLEQIVVGMGCFWGAERLFWQQPGVWTTAVGYAGGFTRNPLYEEVCSGRTGHTEAVRAPTTLKAHNESAHPPLTPLGRQRAEDVIRVARPDNKAVVGGAHRTTAV